MAIAQCQRLPLSKDEMEELYRLETNIWHACDVQRQEGDRLAKVQQARDFNISVYVFSHSDL